MSRLGRKVVAGSSLAAIATTGFAGGAALAHNVGQTPYVYEALPVGGADAYHCAEQGQQELEETSSGFIWGGASRAKNQGLCVGLDSRPANEIGFRDKLYYYNQGTLTLCQTTSWGWNTGGSTYSRTHFANKPYFCGNATYKVVTEHNIWLVDHWSDYSRASATHAFS